MDLNYLIKKILKHNMDVKMVKPPPKVNKNSNKAIEPRRYNSKGIEKPTVITIPVINHAKDPPNSPLSLSYKKSSLAPN